MFDWLKRQNKFDQLVRDFEEVPAVPVSYGSPYPNREQDQLIEIISQPMDGERSPYVQRITRDLTGGLSERER
ncbi:hypothetical protein [Hazenella coriacea]|uniref:Uncharacterized protein n=1 Tax=Hazenella coriacea TaxID=1179467 RepID=A0A4R3KZS8_9BACL|nr:hypothetical protein [Hazenella coriacea]TCS92222.1 hypothetical protein EDD58_11413 [Hazenella coriacea]